MTEDIPIGLMMGAITIDLITGVEGTIGKTVETERYRGNDSRQRYGGRSESRDRSRNYSSDRARSRDRSRDRDGQTQNRSRTLSNDRGGPTLK